MRIRPARPADVEALAVLMEELDHFYGETDLESPEQRAPQIAANLFEEPKAGYVLLAWDGEQLVGMAAYSFLWPAAGVTRSLYLKELYVMKEHRRKGIGALLMQRLCQVAAEFECNRVEWTADADNTLAEGFYEQLGVPKNRDKELYRLEGEGLREMAAGSVRQ
jgi:GNAT superfamily N-acetyltransferase